MNENTRQFLQGVAYACAELVRNHDQQMMAYEIMRAAGLSKADKLKEARVDEYDAKICRKIIRSEYRPLYRRRSRITAPPETS